MQRKKLLLQVDAQNKKKKKKGADTSVFQAVRFKIATNSYIFNLTLILNF